MAFNLSIFKHTKYTFEGKKENEEVEIFLYSHWITLIMRIAVYIVLALVPVIFILVFLAKIIELKLVGLTLFILFSYFMIIWSLIFYIVMLYLLDNWIVTNDRILDIDQKGFFARSVAELNLERVQDISVNTRGLIQTILDFGDLEVQSAGAINKFRFRQIPHPEMVKDKIMKLVEEAKRKSGDTNNV